MINEYSSISPATTTNQHYCTQMVCLKKSIMPVIHLAEHKSNYCIQTVCLNNNKKHYACHPLSRTQIKLLHTNGLPQQQQKHYASHPLGRTLQVSLSWCNDVHTALDPREVSVCRRCLVRPVQPQYVTQSTLDFVYSQQFPGNHFFPIHVPIPGK